jgi:uncharacterized protein
MKVILDTNVLISGIFFNRPPFEILDAWKHSQLQIVLTKEILEEYKRVAESLSEKFPTIDILPIIELLTIHSHIAFPPDPKRYFICKSDPPINSILICFCIVAIRLRTIFNIFCSMTDRVFGFTWLSGAAPLTIMALI